MPTSAVRHPSTSALTLAPAPGGNTAVSRALPGRRACAAAALGLLLAASAIAQPKPATDALTKAAGEPGAQVTASGLVYRSLKNGDGLQPVASDTVRVHYRGTFTNGQEFDSSYKRGQPISFALNRVIPCWTEGVQRMKVGGKARLTCPSAIAYGERGAGDVIPPHAVLHFEVELLGISPR